MDTSTDAARRERIDAVLALAAPRLQPGQQTLVEAFARAYFHHLDSDDLAARAPDELLGALLSSWQFGAERMPGALRLRVLSPTLAEHGWASRHTVIEVVNDDMPFLVDSMTMEISRQGLTMHLIVHPVLSVQRDAQGRLQSLRELGAHERDAQALRESWMHIEIDRLADAGQRAELAAGLERVLGDVRATVQDWKPMLARLQEAIAELDAPPPSVPPEQVQESRAFLQWLADDHFALLGYRRHELAGEPGDETLRLVAGSGLGVLRDAAHEVSASFAALPPQARAMARAPLPLLLVTRSNTRSTVHRPGYSDYVGVKRYGPGGEVIGEHRFIGLFSSSAYSARVEEIPLLRQKVATVMQRAALPEGGHLAKALQHILATYPRDDLFQIGEHDLLDTALGILAAGERQRLRLFLWRDPYERFVSCLVYVPREAYSTELRKKFQAILMAALGGQRADFGVLLGDTLLARVHFTIRTAGQAPTYDRRAIEAQLAAAARRWDDDLRDALVDEAGESRGLALYKRWSAAFPQVYRAIHAARTAVPDVLEADALTAEQPLGLALYRPLGGSASSLGFKVYRLGGPVVLSDSLPMLEHMGVRVLGEDNFRIRHGDGPDSGALVALHDFKLEAPLSDELEFETLARLFEDSFARVFRGEAENDDFNRLVLRAGLAADDIVVLRAYAKYCKQIGFALSQAAIEATLAAQPHIAHMLVRLFTLRLHPAEHDDAAAAEQVRAIELGLDRVANLNEDRVLRQLLALVLATLRTNRWRTGVGHSGAEGPRRSFVSFKFDSARVPGLPEPRPLVEIFVYSPRFEGIHLRGGKVARGGLRWSDRPEDFRTEVLGLVKAQMVKNTVIVPVGSKGGFVLKKAPPASDREAYLKEGVACYQDYLRGLLDLTDNRIAGQVVPPPLVRRLDGDDPYLVVAADKGTASFSDFANAVSAEYGHWLGDAFASGGSVGYDHKAMGITARGAWESVKRHFRELGVDTQSQPFTVAGVGDMSGDVFGNGMLLSRHIRLVAAFDHRHVFIDPTPDAAASFAERERLFALPRSSWADYDASLISAGGGVWSRAQKAIPVSPQACAALGIEPSSDLRLAPAELLSAILKAPVDLLYNGGIGTYVKARSESHAQVGDRANDALRIDGAQLRCKVVGEGGNLGCTQLGRIEAALHGVRINTDAIDNSAGVDTSDHEVNIKILLGLAVSDGEMTEKQRNALLPQMTDDVAVMVLADNYYQTQALSHMRRQGVALLDQQARFMRHLEKTGLLNRAIEFLPDDEQIAEREQQGQGLTGPELAVLLAYGKMWLSDELVDSDLPEDPWVASALQSYFPPLLREKFAAYIPRHPLKREIIATHVLNRMVNRVGPTFVHRLTEMSGAKPSQIVRAFLVMREVFGCVGLWKQIEALDNRVPDALQAEMAHHLRGSSVRATHWLLHPRRLSEGLQAQIDRYTPAVAMLRAQLEPAAAGTPQVGTWVQAGVPPELAQAVAATDGLFDALDMAEIAESAQAPLQQVCELHRELGTRLGLSRVHQQIESLAAEGHWDTLAKVALGEELRELQRQVALEVLGRRQGSVPQMLQAWEDDNRQALQDAQRLLAELADAKSAGLAMLSVALRKLRQLV